jgi:hypothetical protein
MGLSTRLEAWPKGSRRAPRAPHRPQFETLEDRVVPSLADGTILVGTTQSSFSSQDQSSFPTGIIGINPTTGTEFPVSTGGYFSVPAYIAEGPDGQIYVADLQALGTGAIIRVDPNTGHQTVVARGGILNGPNVLTFVNGNLYVADEADGSGSVHNIVQINPNTGQQRLITSGGGFTVPTGMVPAPGNNLYVADEPGGYDGAQPGGVWEVNLITGQQTLISWGNLIEHPVDVTLDQNGNLLIVNDSAHANELSRVVRINPATPSATGANQSLVYQEPTAYPLDGLTENVNTGTIYTGSISYSDNPGLLFAINSTTSTQSVLAAGGLLSLVEGMRVYHPIAQASAVTLNVTSSRDPAVYGQSMTFIATLTAAGTTSTPTGTVQFQLDGSNVGGPVSLSTTNGVTTASYTIVGLAGGTHAVTATYSGDKNFGDSSQTLLGGQVVSFQTSSRSTTTVTSSAYPQVVGQPVNWTATVTPAAGEVNFVNFETGDFSQTATHTGVAAIATSPRLDGTYALQLLTANSIANAEIRQSGTTYYNLPTAYYSFLFEFTSSIGENSIVNFQDTASGFKGALHLSQAGRLLFYDQTGTLVAIGDTVLKPRQVYTISAEIGTGTNAAWQILLNGNVELSGIGNLGSNNNGSLLLGGRGPYSISYFYDDVQIGSQGYLGPIPTGSVQFALDGTNFGAPVPLVDGTATSPIISSLAAGTHTITASYSGNSTYPLSSGTLAGGQVMIPANTLPDGTILVASSPLSGQSSAPTGILAVNPNTGAQSLFSVGGLFSEPESVREGPNQQLYVADYSADGTGAIIAVNPITGRQSVLATGGNINGPVALAIMNGFAYVADAGGGAANLVAVNLSTGQQQVVASGGNLSGLAPAPGDSIYWADEYALGSGAIFQINLQTGAQTVVTQGGLLNHMIDMGLDANGNLIVFNAGGSVVQVNPQTGVQSTLASGGLLTDPDGGTVDASHVGTIYVSNLASGSTPSQILAINPTNGTQQVVSSGGNLSLLTGLIVFNAPVSTNVALSSSADPVLFGQSVTFTATISGQRLGNAAPTGTVQFVIDGRNVGGPVSVSTQNGVTTASFTIGSLGVGAHAITATYSGDGNFLGSSSSLAGGEVVNEPATTTTVSTSLNPSVSGQSVTFTATVIVPNQGSGTLTGMVQFQVDGTNFGSPVQVNSSTSPATASLSTASLPAGNHTITASYVRDANYQTSSGTLTQTVNAVAAPSSVTPAAPVGTTTSLILSASTVPYGQPITLTATVSPGTASSATETGSVTFYDQGTALATVPLTGETASFTISTLGLGGQSLSAAYSGDSNFVASSSSTVAATVGTVNELFVNQLYLTVLQRPVDPQGLATWSTALNQGMSRTAVALAVEESPEALGDQVTAIYQQFLHRTPGSAEIAPYVTFLSTGGTLEAVRTAVTSSAEYFQNRGGGTNTGFVVALYEDALNRSPDPAGMAMFTQELNQGASRNQIAMSIFGSTEFLRDLVAKSYEQILNRPADEAGLDSFVSALQAGASEASIDAALLGSNEFLSHV